MTWKEFLKAHWEVLAATDYFTVEVRTGRGLLRYHLLFVIQLATRMRWRSPASPRANRIVDVTDRPQPRRPLDRISYFQSFVDPRECYCVQRTFSSTSGLPNSRNWRMQHLLRFVIVSRRQVASFDFSTGHTIRPRCCFR
jgi:hypothetical protein